MKSAVYSIVRYLPDAVRGEVFNIAVMVATDDQFAVFGLVAPTRILQASMSANDILACLQFSDYIRDRFENWRAKNVEMPASGFLQFLNAKSPRGFVVDEPLEYLLRPSVTLNDVGEKLFSRLVEPQPLYRIVTEPRRAKASSIVREIINRHGFSSAQVPRRVTVRSTRSSVGYDFDFACANGKLSFGQAVDLDLKPGANQEKNAFEAIANAADILRLFPGVGIVNAVTLPKKGALEPSYWDRLKVWGRSFALPQDEDAFLGFLNRNAEHDVADAAKKLGCQVTSDDSSLQILVDDNRRRLGTPA